VDNENKLNIAGLGELLWDLFPGNKKPGGAPANVAYHASQWGANGIVLSCVGDDERGSELVSYLKNKNLVTDYIQQDEIHPTGAVKVDFEEEEPVYTIIEGVAWDHLVLTDKWVEIAKSLDAICFGTLAQRSEQSRGTIYKLLDCLPKHTLKVLDVNLREPFYSQKILLESARRCNIIKLNVHEFHLLGEIFSQADLPDWLFTEMDIDIICLTKGSEGSELITPGRHIQVEPASVDTSTGDAVGVGDAFTATLIYNLLNRESLQNTLKRANAYAGVIVTKKGGMPDLSQNLISKLL